VAAPEHRLVGERVELPQRRRDSFALERVQQPVAALDRPTVEAQPLGIDHDPVAVEHAAAVVRNVRRAQPRVLRQDRVQRSRAPPGGSVPAVQPAQL
jgi:hypothetical protein